MRCFLLAAALAFGARWGLAGEVRVAVASNFFEVAKVLAARFEAATGQAVRLARGSTGKHYAQIRNGAPFDVFLAADAERPRRLEQAGVARPHSRFSYAIGKVVLWSPKPGYVDPAGKVLETGAFRYLAVANPRLAPYGRAAREILRRRGLWVRLRDRMVRGENIGQTFQFVKSGNAELGFVAYAQVKRPEKPVEGSLWIPPQSLYESIEQQAVLLKDTPAARAFLAFLASGEARNIIQGYGYGIP